MIGPGSRLAHYEVLEAIGKGGMGEVWRAKDTKLGRDVAIKTLPPEFADDPDRLARFEREAKLLASLNHPNIAAIYGLEEDEGSRFLVLELVEGDTLGDRIKRGPIPIEEALNLALQITDALKAAHESGVIHRDLKPDNIKVSEDGNVRVLDFGLAKAMAADETDAAMSNSPTLSFAATKAGVILGTAAYMSPEQAKGRSVDRRADVWAFGCVLFEMLTGTQAFGKSDVTESLSAVISLQPNWDALPRNLHPRLRETIERCLEKPVAKRYQDIGDVKVDIDKVLADPTGVTSQEVAGSVRAVQRPKLSWVAAIALAALIASVAVWILKPAESGPVIRFTYFLGDEPFTGVPRSLVTISPDGMQVVYVAAGQLYLLDLSEEASVPLAGTDEDPAYPSFSPDGESLVFWSGSERSLKTIPVGGGTPVEITSGSLVGEPLGISWEDDGTIFFGHRGAGGIWRVPASGGEPENVVEAGEGEVMSDPSLLPGGNHILYALRTSLARDDSQIIAESLESGERTLLSGGTDPRYVEQTGHLIFAFRDDLFAMRFDPGSLAKIGGQVAVVPGLSRGLTSAHYGISDSGNLVYVPDVVFTAFGTASGFEQVSEEVVLAYVDPNDGAVDGLPLNPAIYRHPRVSSDGTRLAIEVVEPDGQSDVWIYNLSGDTQIQRLTLRQDGNNGRPIWAPDNQTVTFTSDRDGAPSIWSQPADRSEPALQLTFPEEGFLDWPEDWSPDGETLAFTRVPPQLVGNNLWTWDSGTGEVSPLVEEPSAGAAFSPDGRSIAYAANVATNEVYVQRFPFSGGIDPITTNGGSYPIWASNTELFYRRPHPNAATGTRETEFVGVGLVAVSDTAVAPRNERVIPIENIVSNFGYRDYDLMPDGRLLMVLSIETPDLPAETQAPDPRINIVLNWFEELKERVP